MLPGVKTLHVQFTEAEFDLLEKQKGKRDWRTFFLDLARRKR